MPDVEYLEFLVRGLVEFPDQVKVSRQTDEMGVLLSINAASEDMGKIIGREGSHAVAMRTIMRMFGMRNNSRINVKINEPVV